VNIKPDGAIVLKQENLSGPELLAKLEELSKLYPDQAVILRGDQGAPYRYIVNVLDICRNANIWTSLRDCWKQE